MTLLMTIQIIVYGNTSEIEQNGGSIILCYYGQVEKGMGRSDAAVRSF